jgi:hypothetical protein
MQPNMVGGNRKRKSKKQRKTKKIQKSLKKRKYKGGVDYVDMHRANLQSSFSKLRSIIWSTCYAWIK